MRRIVHKLAEAAAHRWVMTDSIDSPRHCLPQLLDTDELAVYLRTPKASIEYWRVTGTGPAFIRIGRKIYYSVPDVLAWLESKKTSKGD